MKTSFGRRTAVAEEHVLCHRMRNGDDAARSELVLRNLPLARWFARRYRRMTVSFEDLCQVAQFAIVNEAWRFDARRARFGTFIAPWIIRALRNFIAADRLVRVPRLHDLRLVSEKLVPFHGDPLQNPETWVPEEKLGVPADQHLACERKMNRDRVRHAMTACLNSREKTILELRYGFDGGGGKTLEAVGQRLDLSRERVRQIEKLALKKLKRELCRSLLQEAS